MARKCGSCNVCCIVMDINDLDPPSPAFTACPHLGTAPTSPGGWKRCTIYEERPPSCRAFKCEWLRGMGSAQDRPDKSFIMGHYSPAIEVSGKDEGEGMVLTELRLRAFELNSNCVSRFKRDAAKQKYNIAFQRMSAQPLAQVKEPKK